jgi:hypothetical protein
MKRYWYPSSVARVSQLPHVTPTQGTLVSRPAGAAAAGPVATGPVTKASTASVTAVRMREGGLMSAPGNIRSCGCASRRR